MFGELSQFIWRFGSDGYAVRKDYFPDGSCKDVFMHRVIADTPDNLLTDHIDGDKLNNTRNNLRHCTNKQNQWNQKPRYGCSSLYKGVIKRKSNFEVNITIDEKVTYIGKFTNEMAAANAYNYYAKLNYGEFAWMNDVPFMSKDEWESYRSKLNKGKSKYTGVHWSKKWEASLHINRKQKFIGYFDNEEDAVKARNEMILKEDLDTSRIQIVN